ncbi:GntR family transcriptional regulator [Sphaerisporangium krabiense]|uniref:DNA-binding transcriptional regulator YhcF (GntR family) n=1 Tax=Sphaerisporangium krabiense TaxID=763782 RepID=A0A7W8Z280_9ACTN|nr:GntR family transcriptional regulator [Sphaerisporangium krabiense]MBB5626118.1 DNA-binding transcriptional regulator YhcF (GntR family) [Sphaerisporangium krabiense]GII67478.1 GntR family transcriptional regulator [Sphaerisporangium krabiense]
MDHPYLRIAAELRRRIRTGELVPGDRAPSTRALARDFGVAAATAVRALAVLKDEGLLEARPRSGTVVAATLSRPRRRGGVAELTRERIVREGIATADAEGLGAVTIRAVAARLGVAATAIYRHVRGRDELVRTMADLAYSEERYTAVPLGRRERLETVARTLWRTYRRHPWLPHLAPLSRPLPLPGLLQHGEQMLRALDGLGLAPSDMLSIEVLIYGYVQGFAVHLERETQAMAATGLSGDQWMGTQERAMNALIASGRAPLFTGLMRGLDAKGYDFDLDTLFEFGLRVLLDGLAIGGDTEDALGHDGPRPADVPPAPEVPSSVRPRASAPRRPPSA